MVLLSLLPGLTVSAQEQKTTAARTVIVVDQAGPVIGASVVIKGTVSGASTDVNGVTTIACPDDAVLSDLIASNLKLRLDHQQHVTAA